MNANIAMLFLKPWQNGIFSQKVSSTSGASLPIFSTRGSCPWTHWGTASNPPFLPSHFIYLFEICIVRQWVNKLCKKQQPFRRLCSTVSRSTELKHLFIFITRTMEFGTPDSRRIFSFCDNLGTFALCGQIIYAPGDTVITHVTRARFYEISCYAHVRQR